MTLQGMDEEKVFTADMRANTARDIWKSPEQRERSRLSTAYKLWLGQGVEERERDTDTEYEHIKNSRVLRIMSSCGKGTGGKVGY